jgi:hypothetical protein
MRAALFLTVSNIFMTFAWYGHLKWFGENSGKGVFPLKIILISWLIALPEYCFQVPGNRIGKYTEHLSLGQLKILQEVITLAVFCVFTLTFMQEKLHWRFFAAFGLMLGAVAVVFTGRQ